MSRKAQVASRVIDSALMPAIARVASTKPSRTPARSRLREASSTRSSRRLRTCQMSSLIRSGTSCVAAVSRRTACATDPEHVFRTEVLCQWPDGSISGPFPPGAWEKGYVELSEEELEEGVPGPDKRLQFPVWAAVDVSGDRSQASICIAGYREDGAVQVELAAQRAGTQWIRGWLAERAGSLIGVTGQTNGAPISKLLEQLTLDHERGEDEEDYFPVPVTPWRNADLTGASGIVFDAIRRNLIAHHRQAPLDRAAAMAITKKSGDTWLFDRLNSPVDISPLIAFTAAYWALTEREAHEAVSEYETGRLEVI